MTTRAFRLAAPAAVLTGLTMASPAAVHAQDAPPTPLLLTCSAAGAVESSRQRYAWVSRPDGTAGYELKTHRSTREETLRFEFAFDATGGRLRMPEEKPGLFSRKAQDGWYPIENLQLGEEAIEGRARIGLIGSMAFRIDRRTGALAIDDYKGECDRMPTERKF